MKIDHLFMLVEPNGPQMSYLQRLGLEETYRRVHHGQGTSNACYCFDNMFLELLWVDDKSAAASKPFQRIGLHQRSLWRFNNACPFGISWRSDPADNATPFKTWLFSPEYLPPGIGINVAEDSDDYRQPLMFSSPGTEAPIDWPNERKGSLQHTAGLQYIKGITLNLPSSVDESPTLSAIARAAEPPLTILQATRYSLSLFVASQEGNDLEIVLS